MTKRGQFLIYCVETYKNAKNLTGRPLAAVKLLPSIRMRMAFPAFLVHGASPLSASSSRPSLFFPMEEQVRRELPPILPAEEMPACPQVVADVSLVIGLAQLGLLPYARKAGDACRLKGGDAARHPKTSAAGSAQRSSFALETYNFRGAMRDSKKCWSKGSCSGSPVQLAKLGLNQ